MESINRIILILISFAFISIFMFSGKESLWSALSFSCLIYIYCETENYLSSAPNTFSSVMRSIPSFVRISLIFISSRSLYSYFLQLWRNHFFWNDLQALKIDKVKSIFIPNPLLLNSSRKKFDLKWFSLFY